MFEIKKSLQYFSENCGISNIECNRDMYNFSWFSSVRVLTYLRGIRPYIHEGSLIPQKTF